MNKNRLAFFDCARALCMLYIVAAWHLYGYLRSSVSLSTPLGNSITRGALSSFFFISAYFLGRRPIHSFRDALDFYKKRMMRFYPLYFISCTSMLVIYLVTGVRYMESVKQYLLTLLGLSTVFTPAPATLWFISMLILFYLITPLVNALQKVWQKVLLCAGLFGLLFILHGIGIPVDPRLPLYLPVYSLGLIIASRTEISGKFRPAVLLISLIAFSGGVALTSGFDRYTLQYLVMLPFIPLILEIGKLIACCGPLERIFGFISYGSMVAYLFHRQFFGLPLYFMGSFPIWFAYLVLVPALLVLSWLAQRCYDRIVGR